MSNSWIILGISVLTEITWALSLKWAQNRHSWTAASVPFTISLLNMWLLSLAMKGIPAGTAYAIWTGLGAVGVAIGGALLFHEPLPPIRLFFMCLVVAGVVGMKLVTP
jgi:quaternary ammonium compound-resistance protein SugE